jgi:gliding motility-associated-like protein
MAYIFDTLSNEECLIQVPSTDSVIVTSLVNVNIIEDSIYVLDGQIDTLHVITANPGGQPLIYTWNPAAHVSQDPVITNTFYATTNGVDSYYYVEVAYGISGCSGIDSVLVLYIPCEGVVKIPNVFTPNNDSKNDTYHIDELCDFDGFRFVIYNRWGKIIFESTDANFHWDGKTTGGTEASEGVYYYVLNSKTQDYKGYIQLIRE